MPLGECFLQSACLEDDGARVCHAALNDDLCTLLREHRLGKADTSDPFLNCWKQAFGDETFADWELQPPDKAVPLHGPIICVRCPLLATMTCQRQQEEEESSHGKCAIHLAKPHNPDAVMAVLECLCTGTIETQLSTAWGVVCDARDFWLKELWLGLKEQTEQDSSSRC